MRRLRDSSMSNRSGGVTVIPVSYHFLRWVLGFVAVLMVSGAAWGQPSPPSPAAPFTATGGTTGRTRADRAADVVNVRDGYGGTAGAKCDGTTNDTASFTAAATQSVTVGKPLYIPGGTCVVDGWAPPTGAVIFGDGQGATILKRTPSSASNAVILLSGVHGVRIYDLTIDGNKANNAAIGYSILDTASSYDVRIERVEVKNSKGAGAAIQLVSTTDDANGTRTELSNLNLHNNDGAGVYVQVHAWNWSVRNSTIRANGGGGVTVINYVFPPVVDSFKNFAITDNDVSANAGGIGLTSFTSGGTLANPTPGVFGTANNGQIARNTVNNNTGYGISAQGVNIEVASNTANNNGTGTGTVYAGILANCSQCNIHDNTTKFNDFYGIDAGGATYTKIHDNIVVSNGNATANSGIGINCGACQHTDIERNFVSSNGTATAGTQIRVSLYDGPGIVGVGFSTTAQDVTIRSNHVVSAFGVQLGVWVTQDPQNMVIEDNFSEGAGDFQAFVLETTVAQIHRNRQDTWFVEKAVNLGSTFPNYPDGLDEITVQSATGNVVNAFWPTFYANYVSAVYSTRVSAAGSAYTTGVTVAFSGGGCSVQPTAAPTTDNAGHVVGVLMLTPGSGCTSAPAVAFTDSAGSGATATAHISSGLPVNGRDLRVLFTGGITVNNGASNLNLLGGLNFTVPSGQSIVSSFQGWSGHWNEAARSSLPAMAPNGPQGRLTLTSGAPVMAADAAAQTTLYYDAYVGANVPGGYGTLPIVAGEISMGLSATNHLSGTVYDVFGVNNAGVLALCTGPAWTSTTARGSGAGTTQIHNTAGYWSNVVALTNCFGGAAGATNLGPIAADQATYLGSFYATANGQTQMKFAPPAAVGGTNAILGLYNGYNRVTAASRSQDSTGSWTDATAATWRAANNSASARVTWLDGLQQSAVTASYQADCSSSSSGTAIGVGVDSITATPAAVAQGAASTTLSGLAVRLNIAPLLGLHFASAMEDDLGGTATCFGGNTQGQLSTLLVGLQN
jgi:hypothetical protein